MVTYSDIVGVGFNDMKHREYGITMDRYVDRFGARYELRKNMYAKTDLRYEVGDAMGTAYTLVVDTNAETWKEQLINDVNQAEEKRDLSLTRVTDVVNSDGTPLVVNGLRNTTYIIPVVLLRKEAELAHVDPDQVAVNAKGYAFPVVPPLMTPRINRTDEDASWGEDGSVSQATSEDYNDSRIDDDENEYTKGVNSSWADSSGANAVVATEWSSPENEVEKIEATWAGSRWKDERGDSPNVGNSRSVSANDGLSAWNMQPREPLTKNVYRMEDDTSVDFESNTTSHRITKAGQTTAVGGDNDGKIAVRMMPTLLHATDLPLQRPTTPCKSIFIPWDVMKNQ